MPFLVTVAAAMIAAVYAAVRFLQMHSQYSTLLFVFPSSCPSAYVFVDSCAASSHYESLNC